MRNQSLTIFISPAMMEVYGFILIELYHITRWLNVTESILKQES